MDDGARRRAETSKVTLWTVRCLASWWQNGRKQRMCDSGRMNVRLRDQAQRSGRGINPRRRKKLIPFHSWKIASHHCGSRRNSVLMRTGWERLRKRARRSITRRRDARPGRTTLQAWWRWPSRDLSSWRWHVRRPIQERTIKVLEVLGFNKNKSWN